MFKKLKQKIGEGVGVSPVQRPSPGDDAKTEHASTQQHAENGASASGHQVTNDFAGRNPAFGVLVNLQDESSLSIYNTPTGGHSDEPDHSLLSLDSSFDGCQSSAPAELPVTPTTEPISRSRTSSVSSVASEASSLFGPVPVPQRHNYTMPSDIESEVEDSGVALHTVSKEDLFHMFRKMQQRSTKYKTKLMQAVSSFQDLEKERDKLRNTLTQSQDKAFRRISELKEQIQLDQLAKQHIEENYTLMIEEKDELVKVLQTQVTLLKEGKEVPQELALKVQASRQKSEQLQQQKTSTPSKTSGDTGDDLVSLRQKVKRLEILLQKCKDTIRNNKERSLLLVADKDALQQQVEQHHADINNMKTSQKEVVGKYQTQLKEARQLIEQLEADKAMGIAEVKQCMHETMESKDQELQQLRDSLAQVKVEKEQLTEKIKHLEKSATEQLEKSREIIRHLQAEKKQLQQDSAHYLESSEQSIEQEKESLIQELKRGKAAALQLMQEQLDQKLAECIQQNKESLQKKDQQLQITLAEKVKEKEAQLEEKLQQQKEEVHRILQEREEEMRLAIEERELQKMAALSQQDSQKDEIQQHLDHSIQRCSELENELARQQEDHKSAIEELQSIIAEETSRSQEDREQLLQKHSAETAELSSSHQATMQKQLDKAREGYQIRLAELTLQQQEAQDQATNEIEVVFRSQIDELKTAREHVMQEHLNKLEDVLKKTDKLEAENKTLQQKLELKIQEHTIQVQEFETRLKDRDDAIEKIHKDRDNLIQKMNEEMKILEGSVSELSGHVEELKHNLHQLASEKEETVNRLCTQIQELESQNKKVNSDLDIKQNELDQHIEEIKLAKENSERELSRKKKKVPTATLR